MRAPPFFFWVFFSSAHNDSKFSGKYVREWQVEKKFKLIVKLTALQASQKFFHLGHLALNMLCMLCVDQKKKKHKGGGSKIQEDEGVIVFADAGDSPHQQFRVASLALWTARAPYPPWDWVPVAFLCATAVPVPCKGKKV